MMTQLQPLPSWTTPTELPDLTKGATILGVDTETLDPDLRTKGSGAARGTSEIIGVSIGSDIHQAIYVPLRHSEGNFPCIDTAMRWVEYHCKTPLPKLGANIGYDVNILKAGGIKMYGDKIDIQIAEALLDENRHSYSLESIAQDYLGIGKDTAGMEEFCARMGWKWPDEFWSRIKEVPAYVMGPYADRDVNLLWPIYQKQLVQLQEKDELGRDLMDAFKLETRLVDMLSDVYFQGVCIDVGRAEQTRLQFLAKEDEAMAEIKRLTGKDVEIWAAASLAEAYDSQGISYSRTTKGAPSFTQEWLDAQAEKDTLSKLVVTARKYNKARCTFIEKAILEKVSDKNRLHPTFLQVRGEQGGTRSYRFSSINPNLQQVPARDPEIGAALRSLFIKDEGRHYFLAADFSAQEIRIGNHLAIKTKAPGYEKLIEAYANNPKIDFHQTVADWTGLPRKQAKVVNLSIQYGAGVNKIASMLGVDLKTAKGILNTYHSSLPFVRYLSSKLMERANQTGFIVEHGGRRCRFHTWERDVPFNERDWTEKSLPLQEAREKWPGCFLKRAFTYKALNRWVQSSAATQTKKAMLACWEEDYVCHLTVHDELTFSVDTPAQARQIGKLMCEAEQFLVPSVVDLEWGPNWGELEKVPEA